MTNITSVNTLVSASKLTCIREERILFDELSFDINAGDIVQIKAQMALAKPAYYVYWLAYLALTLGKPFISTKISIVAAMNITKIYCI